MKKIIILFACISCLSVVAQQKNIKGMVLNDADQPVSEAEIQILDIDENYLQSVATDSLGKFEIYIDFNEVLLYVDAVFYEPVMKMIVIENNAEPLFFYLNPLEEQLSELTINVKRPKIKQKIDRLVFDVENSSLSNLNTWEILK